MQSFHNIHLGLSGLALDADVDLGEGMWVRPTYAHIMGPFLAAFKPAPPGQHHPAPWKALSGGFSFDVSAELFVPAALGTDEADRMGLARTVLFLLRLGGDPAIVAPVLSSHAFAELPNVPDHEARVVPFEIQPRRFPLSISETLDAPPVLRWVAGLWRKTRQLQERAEFRLAAEAIDTGQFLSDPALAMVSLWGALEALFVPTSAELKFRVSVLLAAYLEPPGSARAELQRAVAKLYDKRSAAAHGRRGQHADGLLETFNLVRRVMLRLVEEGNVPTREDLEKKLFGG